MPLPPPLLVTPTGRLSDADRESFDKDVGDIMRAEDGDVVSCRYPIALYHRFDGVWIPVSDIGASLAAPADDQRRDPVESSFVPPDFVSRVVPDED
jgi:hypothetical protein